MYFIIYIEKIIKQLAPSEFNGRVYSILSKYANLLNNGEQENSVKYFEDKLLELRKEYDWRDNRTYMNVVPAEHKSACFNFCLALANKPFERKRLDLDTGFRGLILDLCTYWFSCLKANEQTLILTTSWDIKLFEKLYKKTIDSYTQTHNKRVYIVEVGPSGFFLRYPY